MAEYTVDDMQDLESRQKVRREFAAGAEAAGGKPDDYYFMAERLGRLGDIKGKNYYTNYARELEARQSMQAAETAGGDEAAYAQQSKALTAKGNLEGAATIEAQFAKMNEEKRKRYKEISETGSQLSWGYVQNYNRYVKEFAGDTAKAEEQARLDYMKVYSNTDPTHIKFLPPPEKMSIGVAYTLAGQSEKVIQSITEIEKWGSRDAAVENRSRWIGYRNAAFKELGVDSDTVTPAQLRKIQKDFAATETKPSRAGDKSYTEKQIGDIAAAKDRLESMTAEEKTKMEWIDAKGYERLVELAKHDPDNTDERIQAKRSKKGPTTRSITTDRVKVKGPDGRQYTVPRAQLEKAKAKGYVEVQ